MDKKFRENKEKLIFGSFILILLIALAATYVSIDYTEVEQNYHANASIISEDESENLTVGIDAGQNLNFGKVTEGNNVTKTLNIYSPRKSVAVLDSNGNISEFLAYEEVVFFEGNESVEIEMITKDSGQFEGDLNLRIYVSENRVTDEWLKLRERLQ